MLERLERVEREVATRDGRWHLMRVLPYRTAEDRIDGVVLTFVDITERKVAAVQLRRVGGRLRRALAIETVGVFFFARPTAWSPDATTRSSGSAVCPESTWRPATCAGKI